MPVKVLTRMRSLTFSSTSSSPLPSTTERTPTQSSALPSAKRQSKGEIDFSPLFILLNLQFHSLATTNTLGAAAETMASPTPASAVPTPALSLLVLLPDSGHNSHHPAPLAAPNRPSPLTTRQSGSTIPSLQTIHASTSRDPIEEDALDREETDRVIAAGRRLSLAPGMGGGTQIYAPDRIRLERIEPSPPTSPERPSFSQSYSAQRTSLSRLGESSEAPDTSSHLPAIPTFGTKRGGSGRPGASKRRPVTAAGGLSPLLAPSQNVNGGSFVLPSGIGLGMLRNRTSAKGRPGWEGDELVGVLRGSGLEVTVIRNSSHLPPILSPYHNSPTIPSFSQAASTSRSSTPTAVTHVILVPLGDSPSLPSLSLLLAQGTTPTAVCFQQDLLERAKRTEEEWLPSAIRHISAVAQMRDRSNAANKPANVLASPAEQPIILAYSANPGITSATIAACVDAGASGVLKPPYDLETSRLVRRMVRAAREGRISSVVGLPLVDEAFPRRPSAPLYDDPRVVLPPTALSFGGEREGEKALSAAVANHRRGMSGNWDPPRKRSDAGRARETSGPARKYSINGSLPTGSSIQSIVTPTTARDTSHFPLEHNHLPELAAYMYGHNPAYGTRRRSVDVGGLTIALRRAQKAYETVLSTQVVHPARAREAYSFPANGRSSRGGKAVKRGVDNVEATETELAELLSAMYYQTQRAIDIAMAEYPRLSAPISPSHRARLIDQLDSWDFKPHKLDDEDLFRVACIIFDGVLSIDGVAQLEIERDQMDRLLFAIRAIYHAPNPYHNYVHAIDVLQATYCFLIDIGVLPPFSHLRQLSLHSAPWKRPQAQDDEDASVGTRRAREVMRPEDVLGVLIAAMGHDVGHPGLSNAFMKNAKTPLSQVYEDKSVLENMHCMLVVQLLRKHGFGFLLPCPSADSTGNPARQRIDTRGFRRILYSSVLATDMSLHFAWIAELKNFGQKLEDEAGQKRHFPVDSQVDEEEDEEDRIMICQALIKCADISNPTRPIDVSEHWSSVLLEEWAKQASLEQELDLPVSVIASADAALQAKGQIGFIDLFTQPLFEAVSDVLPELQCYAEWCSDNRARWQNRLEELQQSKARLIQPAIEGEAQHARFRSLFPLSLPTKMVSPDCLELGPTTPSTSPTTPQLKVHPATNGNGGPYENTLRDSPSAKAMRAVYHSNLLDQRHRLSSWSRGPPMPGGQPIGFPEARRMSTPDGFMNRTPLEA